MIGLILGIVLIIGTIAAIVYAINETPDNLVGFYGFFYFLISLAGFIGGVALVLSAFF